MTTQLPLPRIGLLLLACALVLAPRAWAQEAPPAPGSIRGQLIDSESAAPIEGVKVTLSPSPGAAGGAARELEQVTDATGAYEFPRVPAGSYSVKFTKSGYRVSLMTSFAVTAGEVNRADFPLPPLPPQATEEMPGFEEFVVEASPMEEILAASRMESDELLNTLNAAEFAKFAASDVADALKFVPGVNVVEGQFAIIRGLEDRYSSTLYNSAVVPSPDPDSQSVQLDLFPSDIVTNLVVAKTFGPNLPSNSSGGSINILTNEYPESFEIKFSAGSGWNSNAVDDFYELNGGSPTGSQTDGWDTAESDFGMSIGGRGSLFEREIRFKAIGASEVDYQTGEGTESAAEPQRAATAPVPIPGGLSLGELALSDGTFDLTESEESKQKTGYAGLGFDLDPDGAHTIDANYFYTEKKDKTVQLYQNGWFEGFDYGPLAERQANNDDVFVSSFDGTATRSSWIARSIRANTGEPVTRGPLFGDSFAESDSFDVTRDLVVYQLNGDHSIGALDGLHLSWAANTARTSQTEESLGARYFYEPDDLSQVPTTFPSTVDSLGPGRFYVNDGIFASSNDVHEKQSFARADVAYEFDLSSALRLKLDGGYWYEHAKRDVESDFLESPTVSGSSQFALSCETAECLGSTIGTDLDLEPNGQFSGARDSENDSSRDIQAGNFGAKLTIWDDLDLLAGARWESILIESNNDPFTGEPALDGTPAIFPTKYLFFDRLDNPARGEGTPNADATYNDQLLGIAVPIDPSTGLVDLADEDEIRSFIDGEIDEHRVLPAFGFTYRPLEGLNLRGAYSQTVARPSFRELGYYVSVEPGSDDLIVGNPQLQLSDVVSYDLRTEYSWGETGDLAAFSVFYKTIDDPIESIIIRNPLNSEGSSSALFRTFFNNPSEARLYGVEVEGRKNLGFLGPDFAQYFSIGGNFTYIDAKVDRTDAELARANAFFGAPDGVPVRFSSYEKDRRLFGQPEWIANVDLSYDNPDWGTKITLSYFAISEILDAAGSAATSQNGEILSLTLDRYLDSFDQLNLVVSQTWQVNALGGDVTLKGNVKNLTDSERRVIYDEEQTRGTVVERSLKLGLDYSISLTYSLSF
ncbi:MAG: TonB-dependent receptor [Myxococcota bacterium]